MQVDLVNHAAQSSMIAELARARFANGVIELNQLVTNAVPTSAVSGILPDTK